MATPIVQYIELAPVLRACPGLTSLDLSHNEMSEIAPIATALAGCTGLTRLDLSANDLHFREDTLLGLHQCKALRELNLFGNRLNENDISVLANTVGHLPALADLNLGRSAAGAYNPGNVESLMTALATSCTGLTRLRLHENEMVPDAVEGLCKALPRLAALVHLDLAENNMGARGLNHLGEVLAKCTSLESLDVKHCGIQPSTAPSFTDALPRCQRLRRLDLSLNKIGGYRFRALVEVLSRCTALEHLSMYDCELELGSETWLEELPRVLSECYALRELDLRKNRTTPTTQALLRPAWATVEGREPARLLLLDAPVP
jgi:Ran GTPase-activating protein (RanGAP) involved in mRNA processing and transport